MQLLWLAKSSWNDNLSAPLFIKWRELNDWFALVSNKIWWCIKFNSVWAQSKGLLMYPSRAIVVVYTSELSMIMVRFCLTCSKSMVTPSNKVLELCSCLLFVCLFKSVAAALNPTYEFNLYSESSSWKTFVANRMHKIQLGSVSLFWHHMRSQNNPTDILSRIPLQQVVNFPLWWHGPLWLLCDPVSHR